MKIDIAAAIGAANRRVTHLQRDNQTVHAVEASRVFPTTPDDLWDAVANPERLPRWFLPVTGDLRPGGRFQLEGNAGGEILRCEPPRELAVTWEFGGGLSWLDVRVEAQGPGTTLLVLVHTVPDDAHWRQYGAGATGAGWDMALLGLAEHLSTGAAVDAAKAMAWMTSAAGHDFIRQSSDGWVAAAKESGMAATEAEEAGRATLSFYTGGAL